MAAVGETTAALSHSIKNILQALRGGADVVEMGLRGSNIAAGRQRLARRRSQPGKNLQPDDESPRLQPPREPQLEQINPKVLIDECLELIAAAANEKGVMAVADVEPDIPPSPPIPTACTRSS